MNTITEQQAEQIEQIEDVLKKGIERFEKPYHCSPLKIQIKFQWENDEVQYMMCVDQQPKNTVTLKQLIGWNVYNGKVEKIIGKLLNKLAVGNGIEFTDVRVMAFYGENIRLVLMNKTVIVRDVETAELLN